MKESEWLSVKIDHPLLQSAEVTRVAYEGHLGATETLSVTLNTTESATDLGQLVQTPVTLSIENNATLWHFNTVLTAISVGEVDELLHRNHVTLQLSSPLIQLKDTCKSSVLYHANLKEVFSYLLSDQQAFETAVTHCDLDQYLPPFKSSEESDLMFFQRILAFYGLTYYFDHSKKGAPLIITDQVTAFGQTVRVPVFTHVNGELVSAPYIDQVFPSDSASSSAIRCTGHPDSDPTVLFANSYRTHAGHSRSALEFQADFAERSDADSANHSQFLAESLAGKSTRTRYLGGGILFPSQVLTDQSQFLVETTWTLDMDSHAKNRIKSLATTLIAQPLSLPYRDAISMLEEEQILAGHALSGSESGVSTNAMGHYEVELPAYFTQNQSGETLEETRMLYPVQSDDHGHHYTLIKEAEGIQFWFGGNLAQSLLIGTANSVDSPHLTQESTYQNAYWQDDQQNKVAFLNQAPFDPNASTGRLSSHVLEAPLYHPESASSLFRMGDAHPIEGTYPAQAAETGILAATTGHYYESHEGAMLALAGNFGEDPFNPVPALRHRVEVAPSEDSAHLLQSINAHLHTESSTSTQVTETHQLTEGTLTHSLTSPDTFKTHLADEVRNWQVNQVHTQTGEANTFELDTHLSNTHALQKTLIQEGKTRQDVFNERSLLLSHTQNTYQQDTHIKNTQTLWEEISLHTSNATTHSKTTQAATDQAANLSLISSTLATLATTTHINANTDIDTSGTGVPAPNTAAALNDLALPAIQDEQSPLKKEIVFLLDDPTDLIKTPPQLQVNTQNPTPISKNSPFIYPLDDTQKQGPIQFLYPISTGTATTVLHPQIRNINVQRNSPVQMPKAWFNQKGQMGGYLGLRQIDTPVNPHVPGASSLGTHILLGAKIAEYGALDFPANFDLFSPLYEEQMQWIGDKLKTLLRTESSEHLAMAMANLSLLAQQNNRDFLMALLKTGTVKSIKTSLGAVLALSIHSANLAAPFALFADSPGIVAWNRIYDWSKTLTPAQELAYAEKVEETKKIAIEIPVLDILFVNVIDVAKGLLEHENPGDVLVNMFEDTANTFFSSLIVVGTWLLFSSERLTGTILEFAYQGLMKLQSRILMSWVGKTAFGIGVFSALELAENKLGIHDAMENSKIIQTANQFMGALNHPEQINWMQIYGAAEVQAIDHEGPMAVLSTIGE